MHHYCSVDMETRVLHAALETPCNPDFVCPRQYNRDHRQRKDDDRPVFPSAQDSHANISTPPLDRKDRDDDVVEDSELQLHSNAPIVRLGLALARPLALTSFLPLFYAINGSESFILSKQRQLLAADPFPPRLTGAPVWAE